VQVKSLKTNAKCKIKNVKRKGSLIYDVRFWIYDLMQRRQGTLLRTNPSNSFSKTYTIYELKGKRSIFNFKVKSY